MTFQHIALRKAKLIKRYKRFLADVILEDGSETTMHVANTGAMTGCADSGDYVWYSTSENPKRKYAFSWELTEKPNGNLICVNTARANQLTELALEAGNISELTNFTELKREVKYGSENSKIDFNLTDESGIETFIEVKSATLLENGQGYFPDTVTTRGQKHLRELIDVVAQGKRAVLLFAVLHTGIHSVKAAEHLDSKYAALLKEAKNSGVEILAYKASFTSKTDGFELALTQPLNVEY